MESSYKEQLPPGQLPFRQFSPTAIRMIFQDFLSF